MSRIVLYCRLAPVVLCAMLLSPRFWFCRVAAAIHWDFRSRDAQTVSPAQLEALSGEYTDTADPDTPLSFYVRNGKLVGESERDVPEELRTLSALEFGFPHSGMTFRFTLEASGHGESMIRSTGTSDVYRRTGRPFIMSSTITSGQKR